MEHPRGGTSRRAGDAAPARSTAQSPCASADVLLSQRHLLTTREQTQHEAPRRARSAGSIVLFGEEVPVRVPFRHLGRRLRGGCAGRRRTIARPRACENHMRVAGAAALMHEATTAATTACDLGPSASATAPRTSRSRCASSGEVVATTREKVRGGGIRRARLTTTRRLALLRRRRRRGARARGRRERRRSSGRHASHAARRRRSSASQLPNVHRLVWSRDGGARVARRVDDSAHTPTALGEASTAGWYVAKAPRSAAELARGDGVSSRD